MKPYWGPEHPGGRGLTSDQLEARLQEFTFQFSRALQSASLVMCSASDDLDLRRNTIFWRAAIVPEVRRAATHDSPVDAFIDTWTLCMQQVLFMEKPEAEELFRGQASVALRAATNLETEIEKLGASFMKQEDLARAREDVRDFALAHPFQSGWSRHGNLPSTAGGADFEWIVGNPLNIVNPFSGLNSGADAIREFTKVAEDFLNLVGHMPEELSWKMELFLTEAEERGHFKELNGSIDSISGAAVSLAATADRLPEETRKVISQTFEELGGQYEPLQATLAESHATMAELNSAVSGANQLVTSLDATLERARVAGEAWEAVFASFSSDEEPPPEDDTPSFAEEWDSTAQKVTEAAVEIRGMLADVRALSTSEEKEALAKTATTATFTTIDHAAWRSIQVILCALGASLVHVVVRRRLLRS